MDVEKGERKTIQISLAAHKALEAACKRRPVERSMYSAASRLIEWFVRQPSHIKAAVLSDVDEGMELVYAESLELLAASLRAKAMAATGRDEAGRLTDRPHAPSKPTLPPVMHDHPSTRKR